MEKVKSWIGFYEKPIWKGPYEDGNQLPDIFTAFQEAEGFWQQQSTENILALILREGLTLRDYECAICHVR